VRRVVGEYVFAALYQQRPEPAAGGVFKRLWWRYWSPIRTWGNDGARLDLAGKIVALADTWRFITADLAVSTKTSADWTVFSAWALTLDGDLVLLDRTRAKVGEEGHFALCRPLAERWKVDTAFVEKSQHGTTLATEAAHAGLHLTPLDADSDKFTRALPASARASGGRMWLPAGAYWLEEWIGEHASFPNGAHDDQVDTSGYATRVAVTKWSPKPLGMPPPQRSAEIDFMKVPL
jgi:predicted phage terminase large subunit-like protein